MSNSTSTLVLGAGELGIPVIKSLAANAPPNSVLKVLLRPSTSPGHQALLSELHTLNVLVTYGNIATDSVDVLADLFRGHTTIISCVGFAAGPGTQLKLARAVLAAGVPRYMPWQFGVDYDVIGRGSPQDLFDEQLGVRDLLRAQTHTLWRIVSTGMFTSFLFEPSFGVVDLEAGVCRALGGWETAVTVTTPEDIGMLTARIAGETWDGSGVVYTAGDTLTYGALADTVERILEKTVEREVWSVERLVKELKDDPQNGMKKYRAVFGMGKGVSWPIEGTYNFQKDVAVEGVESWLKRHLNNQ
ncbi:saccharopine dehydrogenase-like oxidoreductase [Mycena rosella]|uniref:Saccharopine dehydrogenase-like oxidoreductase n=1 Tax=Mycena rosella TaxID=1033263 RepID=A0AAD7GJF7_MYCRO|nr:saccharopine dehydrogenase-like oxidoreductase [Mycena rosella]